VELHRFLLLPKYSRASFNPMAEVLAVAGGIASFGQIVLGFMKIGDSFSQLLKDYHNAPSELARIHQKITFVQETATVISNILSAYPVDLQPPSRSSSTAIRGTFARSKSCRCNISYIASSEKRQLLKIS